jgi:hypothetical protein
MTERCAAIMRLGEAYSRCGLTAGHEGKHLSEDGLLGWGPGRENGLPVIVAENSEFDEVAAQGPGQPS